MHILQLTSFETTCPFKLELMFLAMHVHRLVVTTTCRPKAYRSRCLISRANMALHTTVVGGHVHVWVDHMCIYTSYTDRAKNLSTRARSSPEAQLGLGAYPGRPSSCGHGTF